MHCVPQRDCARDEHLDPQHGARDVGPCALTRRLGEWRAQRQCDAQAHRRYEALEEREDGRGEVGAPENAYGPQARGRRLGEGPCGA